jgi:hypothetical protein
VYKYVTPETTKPFRTMEYEVQSLSFKQILSAGLKACYELRKQRAEQKRAKQILSAGLKACYRLRKKRAEEKRANRVTLHDLDRIHEMLVSAGLERMKKK